MFAPGRTVPDSHRDLLERPILAMLATVAAGSRPEVSPVWTQYVDGKVVLSSLASTKKAKQLGSGRRAALCYLDDRDPYRYLELRCVVESATDSGAHAHLDLMAQRYMNRETYPGHDYAAPRMLFTLRPERVIALGGSAKPVESERRG